MSSRALELERSTASGDALEAEIVQALASNDLTLEQRREIAETSSSRAVTFEVESEIIADTD